MQYVIISDIHFSLTTLEEAATSLTAAFEYAQKTGFTLIVAGDLLNDKANLRAEVVNRILTIYDKYKEVPSYTLVGNHCMVNHKGVEHALNFLVKYTKVVDLPIVEGLGFMPYQVTREAAVTAISNLKAVGASTIIAHQGLGGTLAGEYIMDPTAFQTQDIPSNLNIISGHYHESQEVVLPNGSKWTYIGNPYTQNYGETNHPDKGFLLLKEDGTIERIPLNLRKHRVVELGQNWDNIATLLSQSYGQDKVKLKLSGTENQILSLNKSLLKHFDKVEFNIIKEVPKHSEREDWSSNTQLVKFIEKSYSKEESDKLIPLARKLLC